MYMCLESALKISDYCFGTPPQTETVASLTKLKYVKKNNCLYHASTSEDHINRTSLRSWNIWFGFTDYLVTIIIIFDLSIEGLKEQQVSIITKKALTNSKSHHVRLQASATD